MVSNELWNESCFYNWLSTSERKFVCFIFEFKSMQKCLNTSAITESYLKSFNILGLEKRFLRKAFQFKCK